MTWKLLVVDDEPLNLEIIGEFLDDPDYQLSFAEDGEAGWEVLAQATEPFDLVILDRMMPRLDGLSLLKRIKDDPTHRSLPVIMQTAASSPQEIREGIEAGAYYYLTKPYQPEALLGIVRAAIADIEERRRAGAAIVRQGEALLLLASARFEFRSLDDAHLLAGTLAGICPDPASVAMGLTELLVNAVEHGNLGISYAEKKRLRESEGWEEEVARRLALPEFSTRTARVIVERGAGMLSFTVEDDGAGFDWQRYLDFDPDRAFDPNGRGIAMARQISFRSLEYSGRGNVVRAEVALGGEGAAIA